MNDASRATEASGIRGISPRSWCWASPAAAAQRPSKPALRSSTRAVASSRRAKASASGSASTSSPEVESSWAVVGPPQATSRAAARVSRRVIALAYAAPRWTSRERPHRGSSRKGCSSRQAPEARGTTGFRSPTHPRCVRPRILVSRRTRGAFGNDFSSRNAPAVRPPTEFRPPTHPRCVLGPSLVPLGSSDGRFGATETLHPHFWCTRGTMDRRNATEVRSETKFRPATHPRCVSGPSMTLPLNGDTRRRERAWPRGLLNSAA